MFQNHSNFILNVGEKQKEVMKRLRTVLYQTAKNL